MWIFFQCGKSCEFRLYFYGGEGFGSSGCVEHFYLEARRHQTESWLFILDMSTILSLLPYWKNGYQIIKRRSEPGQIGQISMKKAQTNSFDSSKGTKGHSDTQNPTPTTSTSIFLQKSTSC